MINILWDMDGTVVDSMPVITGCLNKTASHFKYPTWPTEALQPLIGPELRKTLAIVLNSEDPQLLESAVTYYRTEYKKEIFDSPVFAELEPVIRYFDEIGCQQFIATAKYQLFAERIIDHLELTSLFTGVYGTTVDGQYSDKKDLLAMIMAEEKLNSNDTIMIGDTQYDIEAGRHHNLTTIGVLWGYSDENTLKEHGAHHCVAQPSNLVDTVKSLVMCAC